MYQGEGEKGRHPPAFLLHMGKGLHAETECRKMLGKYLSAKKNPIEAKETIGDGGGRNYDNSRFSNQHRQDAISKVSAVQNSARVPR